MRPLDFRTVKSRIVGGDKASPPPRAVKAEEEPPRCNDGVEVTHGGAVLTKGICPARFFRTERVEKSDSFKSNHGTLSFAFAVFICFLIGSQAKG